MFEKAFFLGFAHHGCVAASRRRGAGFAFDFVKGGHALYTDASPPVPLFDLEALEQIFSQQSRRP